MTLFQDAENPLRDLLTRQAELKTSLESPYISREDRRRWRDELTRTVELIAEAKLELARAELAAETELRDEWLAIRDRDRVAVLEFMATTGWRAWRAHLTSGGRIAFEDWFSDLYPAIVSQIAGDSRDPNCVANLPVPDAPAVDKVELSAMLTAEERAELRQRIA